jgi:hypothetical protein
VYNRPRWFSLPVAGHNHILETSARVDRDDDGVDFSRRKEFKDGRLWRSNAHFAAHHGGDPERSLSYKTGLEPLYKLFILID